MVVGPVTSTSVSLTECCQNDIEISLIEFLKAALRVLPVLNPPYGISDFRLHVSEFHIKPLKCPTTKTWDGRIAITYGSMPHGSEIMFAV
jgi:hypothetical protein